MTAEKNDGSTNRYFSLANLFTLILLGIGSWILSWGLLEDVNNGGDGLRQMLLFGAGGTMIVWGFYRTWRFAESLRPGDSDQSATTDTESSGPPAE